MKYIATILIMIVFGGVAIFGVTLIDHGMMNHNDCVVSTMVGDLCPTNQIQLFIHHLSVAQIFSNVVLPQILSLAVIALLLLLLSYLIPLYKIIYLPPRLFAHHPPNHKELRPADYAVLHWLALFENSPSFS